MPRYVAFLRAVNVGGVRTVKMATLCKAFEGMGFTAVSSYIASGNIIFTSAARNTAMLEDRIEAGLMQAVGYELIPFLRTTADLARIAKLQPFPPTKVGPADQLGVVFLSIPLPAQAAQALMAIQGPTDEFRVEGREVYWLRHLDLDGQIRYTVPFDRLIEQPFTIRSANTVARMAEKYHTGAA